MKRNEFNNFFEFIKTDTKNAECLAWAFLNMTEKQGAKVIEWYKENGMYEIRQHANGLMYEHFGTNLQYHHKKEVTQ